MAFGRLLADIRRYEAGGLGTAGTEAALIATTAAAGDADADGDEREYGMSEDDGDGDGNHARARLATGEVDGGVTLSEAANDDGAFAIDEQVAIGPNTTASATIAALEVD